MTKLESLYEKIGEAGIEVVDVSFSETKKAACLHVEPVSAILLDKTSVDSLAEELCLLAEEYYHYETGALFSVEATFNERMKRINRIVAEGRVKRAVIYDMIPLDELIAAFESGLCEDVWGIAEEFGVTVELAEKALDLYEPELREAFQSDEDWE